MSGAPGARSRPLAGLAAPGAPEALSRPLAGLAAPGAPEARSRPGLARRLLWRAVPLVLTVLSLAAGANYFAARARILTNVGKEVRAYAEQAAFSLGSFFGQREWDIEVLAGTPLLADHYKNTEYGLRQEAEAYRREIGRYLLRFMQRSGVYASAMYLDSGGRVLAGAEDGRLLRVGAPSGWDRMAELRRAGQDRSPISDRGDRRCVYFAKTLTDELGRFRGAVVLALDLRHAEAILERMRVGERGRAWLVDLSGATALGRPSLPSEGLLGEAPVEGTPWRVRVAADPSEFLRPLRRVRDWTVVSSVAGGLLVTALLAWRVRRETDPIAKMVEGTRRLASGDLSHRFKLPETAELATLAQAFNEMASSLQHRTGELERRVRQLNALREMETAVLGRLSEEEILKTCLRTAVEGLGFDRGVLYWVEDGSLVGRLTHRTEDAGLTPAVFRRRRIRLDSGDILAETVRTREPRLVLDPGSDPRINPAFVKESGTQGFILAPLLGKDRVLGVIGTDTRRSKRPLSVEDRDNLMLFAGAAGLALENANLLERLVESETRHRQVLDGSTDAIIGLDRELKVTTWNQGARTLLGLPSALAAGRPLREAFPEEARDHLAGLLGELQAQGSVRDRALPGTPLGGKPRDLVASVQPTAGGGWSLVIRDETDKKVLQAQLVQAEKMSAIGKLISSVAHELNNPLATVVGFADLLRDKRRPDEELKEGLRLIHLSALQCRGIIESLLLFARRESPGRTRVLVREAVERALDLLQFKLKRARRIELEVDVPRALRAWADPQQLQQVAVNLISNAADAMLEKRTGARLTIRAGHRGPRVRIAFEDSGPGVAPALRPGIFEPFFTTKPEGEGTGLGLSVSRQILRGLGGDLVYEEAPSGGARFVVELQGAGPTKGPVAPCDRGTPRARGRNLKVLVVDDDPAVLEMAARSLASLGHRARRVRGLAEARRAVRASRPDIVLADLTLGEESGLDLLEAGTPCPVLFMTGRILDPGTAAALKKAGASWIEKPFSLCELQGALCAALRAPPSRPK